MIIDWATSSTCISKSVAQTSAEYAGWFHLLDGKVFNQNCKVAMLQPVVYCDCDGGPLCLYFCVQKNLCSDSVICFVNILVLSIINCFSVLMVTLWMFQIGQVNQGNKFSYIHRQEIWWYEPMNLFHRFSKGSLLPSDTTVFSSLTHWVQRISMYEVHTLPLNSGGKIRCLGKYKTHVLRREKINANQWELRMGFLYIMNTIPLQSIDSGFKPVEWCIHWF